MSEHACIESLRLALSSRKGGALAEVDKPDKRERQQQAIDSVLSDGEAYFAVEHTVIQSLPQELQLERRWSDLQMGLAERLSPLLPDGAWQYVPDQFDSSTVRSAQFAAAIESLATAIQSALPGVTCFRNPSHLECSVSRVPHQEWPGTLYRWEPLGKVKVSLLLAHERPVSAALDKAYRTEFARVLEKKVPKLLAASTDRTSVLLIESRNVQLANPIDIAAIAQDELAGCGIDLVILASSHNGEVYGLYDCIANSPFDA